MQDREANSSSGNSTVDLPSLQAWWRAEALCGTGGQVQIMTNGLKIEDTKLRDFSALSFGNLSLLVTELIRSFINLLTCPFVCQPVCLFCKTFSRL